MAERRVDLAACRLYLVCDASFTGVAEAVAGGVDIVQLRERSLADGDLLAAAMRFRELTRRLGVPFLVNDRPDLAVLSDADGVHLGQDDLPPAAAREIVGGGRVIGLSTHSSAQIEAAAGVDVDYIGVGPVHATPTKPGRSAVGGALVEAAARLARQPWFAIGGIDEATAAAVVASGARRLAVVRAITGARDPRAAATALRSSLA